MRSSCSPRRRRRALRPCATWSAGRSSSRGELQGLPSERRSKRLPTTEAKPLEAPVGLAPETQCRHFSSFPSSSSSARLALRLRLRHASFSFLRTPTSHLSTMRGADIVVHGASIPGGASAGALVTGLQTEPNKASVQTIFPSWLTSGACRAHDRTPAIAGVPQP